MDDVVKSLLERQPPKITTPAPVRPTREEAEAAVRTLFFGPATTRSAKGCATHRRGFVKAYEELFSGYKSDGNDVLSRVFEEVQGYDDLILVRDIPFFSHCEHHMVPFIGKAHIAYYVGEEGVVGLSKLARLVDIYARRLQTQEALTAQIIGAIDKHLRPRGAAVMLEAEHLCMSMRGVQKQGASTITNQFTGVFRDDPAEQVRFLTLVRGK